MAKAGQARGDYSQLEEVEWKQLNPPMKSKLMEQLKKEAEKRNSEAATHEKPVFCHRIVLTLYSARASRLSFDRESVTDLHEIPKDIALLVIQWMYNEGKNLNDILTSENIVPLYSAGIQLEMEDLLFQLDNIVKMQPDPLVLLPLLRLFREANKNAMLKFVLERACDNALTILDSEVLMQLDLAEVKSIFSDDRLNISTELQVLESAIAWLGYKWADRRDSALDLLSCVRFGLLSKMKLISLEGEYAEIMQDAKVKRMIREVLAYKLIEEGFGAQSQEMENFLRSSNMAKPVARIGMTYFTDSTSDGLSTEWSESTFKSL